MKGSFHYITGEGIYLVHGTVCRTHVWVAGENVHDSSCPLLGLPWVLDEYPPTSSGTRGTSVEGHGGCVLWTSGVFTEVYREEGTEVLVVNCTLWWDGHPVPGGVLERSGSALGVLSVNGEPGERSPVGTPRAPRTLRRSCPARSNGP